MIINNKYTDNYTKTILITVPIIILISLPITTVILNNKAHTHTHTFAISVGSLLQMPDGPVGHRMMKPH